MPESTDAQQLPELLTEQEAAQYLHKSKSWLQEQRWRKNLSGPPFRKIGRTPMYVLDELSSWLMEQ